MEKLSSTSNFKKLPQGFLLALFIIIIFETLNAVFDNYFYQPPYDGLRVKVKNEMTIDPKNKLDFLVLGDCYPLIGVIPKIIEGRTGLLGFNFSTHLDYSIFSSYCFLKNYLRTCAKKPKYLIISFLPESCRLTKAEIEKNDFGYFYDFSKNNEMSFIGAFGFKKSLPFMVPSLKHQYLYKDPLALPSALKAILENAGKTEAYIEKVKSDQGRSDLVEDNIFISFPVSDNRLQKFYVSGFFDQYLRSILNLANHDNIDVLYIFPTRPSEIYKAEEKSGAVRAYWDYLETLKAQYPNLILLEAQNDFDQVFSYSGELHLNFWGAISLSDIIAGKISRQPSP